MTNQTIKIHNVETNEIIERDMTESELREWELVQQIKAQHAEAEAAKTAQRQAILDRLGLTADEAALLLGVNE